MSYNPHDPRHDKDIDVDIDVDVKKETEFKKDVDVEVDVKKEETFKKDVEVDVDIKKEESKKEVDVDVDVKKEEFKKDVEVDIKKEEKFSKDVDIDVDVVKKDVDVDVDVDKNIWDVKVEVEASSIVDGDDNDVNDIDNQKLIDVGPGGRLELDDFSVRQLAIGNSFNGGGNDSQYSVTQSNNLTDNDKLIAPTVAFFGQDGNSHSDTPTFDLWQPPRHDDKKDGDSPFQKVEADGGEATADDGIDGNSNANDNDADGSVSGEALASADGIANVSAFTQDIVMGANQQGNFATLDVAGGDRTEGNNVGGQPASGSAAAQSGGNGGGDGDQDGGLAVRGFDNDVNDLDAQSLINVNPHSAVTLDDFRLDTVAIGGSFNGAGNDMQFDVVQVNDMLDNDFLYRPEVKYIGPAGNTFQDVTVDGGEAQAGDGIVGNSTANNNGLNGSVAGSTAATADGIANVSAFTQNIVMGANLQVNNLSATVAGGDSTFADDITG
jgi:hypothetical protein